MIDLRVVLVDVQCVCMYAVVLVYRNVRRTEVFGLFNGVPSLENRSFRTTNLHTHTRIHR